MDYFTKLKYLHCLMPISVSAGKKRSPMEVRTNGSSLCMFNSDYSLIKKDFCQSNVYIC